MPSQGGDYISQIGNFIFTPGSTRSCLDLFIFQDRVFELTEDLNARVLGYINSQGAQVTTLNGVTASPDTTIIQIGDANRELPISINLKKLHSI